MGTGREHKKHLFLGYRKAFSCPDQGHALLFNPESQRQEGHFLCSQEFGFSPSAAIWVWEHSSARELADLEKETFQRTAQNIFFKLKEKWKTFFVCQLLISIFV